MRMVEAGKQQLQRGQVKGKDSPFMVFYKAVTMAIQFLLS